MDMRLAHPRNCIAGLLRDDSGSVVPLMAVLIVVLCAVGALGIEISGWYEAKKDNQRVADAAAVEAAFYYSKRTDLPGAFTAAANSAKANGAAVSGTCAAVVTSGTVSSCAFTGNAKHGMTVSYDTATERFSAQVTRTDDAMLSQVFGASDVSVASLGSAKIQPAGTAPCVLGLASSGSSVKISGGGTISAPGCSVMSNGDITVSGGSTLSADAAYADESITTNGSGSSVNAPDQQQGSAVTEVTDPYAGMGYTDTSSCTATGNGNKWTSSGTPPTCTSAWKIQNGDNVTLSSGHTYYVNGDVEITGGSVTGTNVTIVAAGNIKITGGTVTLTAPTSGKYSGVVLVSAQATATPKNNITGGASLTFTGLIYTPYSDIDFRGNTSSASTTCLLIVGNTVDVAGGSTAKSSGCAAAGLNTLPTAGISGGVSLVN